MFGLFNKNNDKEKSKEEAPEFLVLVEKWDAFLTKMDTRFEESIGHAEAAIMENLVESDFDILPTVRSWQAIKTQLMGLTDKIDSTFENKVKPQMKAYKEDWDLIDENQKGVQLTESIYDRLERYERQIEGRVSQKFYDHAIQLLNEDFNCTQCSAKLEVKKDIFRSHYVSCDYCNSVNTFTPNSKISEIKGFAIDNIAKYKALNEWDFYKKSLSEFHKIRPPRQDEDKLEYIAGFKKRAVAERAYWERYFTERSLLLPEYKESIAHDVNMKMEYFHQEEKRALGTL